MNSETCLIVTTKKLKRMNTNKFVSDIAALKIDEINASTIGKPSVFGNDFIIIPDLKLGDLQHAPMQLGFLVMCFCSSGVANFTLSEKKHEFKQGDLLILLGLHQSIFRKWVLSANYWPSQESSRSRLQKSVPLSSRSQLLLWIHWNRAQSLILKLFRY